MTHFIHPRALVETGATIGDGSRVWAFAHILPGARIGKDCNICDGVFVENDVSIGDRVTVKCGVQLWDGVRLEDDVFVGPNATFTNDIFPRSKKFPEKFLATVVGTGASIGANATILPGLKIGKHAMIGAGAVVVRDVPPYAILVGNPAAIVGYAETAATSTSTATAFIVNGPQATVEVGGARLYRLPLIRDLRGNLVVAQFDSSLPFVPKRCFTVLDVPSREVRGEHAHKTLNQLLVCLKGQVSVVVDDGTKRAEICLDNPTNALYIPARVWSIQYKFTTDAVLTVFASDIYNEAEYIRSYEEFLKFIAN
jgi:UDP-2-acetamido-3-amino-2,3-dideoxy-glucuronate N-acetyltransferase